MKSEPGIAAKMFRVLAEQGINLQMIDTSTIRITVVIDRREVERAVRALHDAFDLAGEAARRRRCLTSPWWAPPAPSGTVMLRVLEERGFPVTELRPLASSRSAGRELDYLGQGRTVRELTADSFEGIQIALFSAGATRSREFAPAAVEAGAVVIDNSSAYRMDDAVPLVVPEVNEGDLEGHAGIVANPNCVAAPLVVALKPLRDAVGLERVIVSSYQSVSGTGQAAVTELREQAAGFLAGDEPEPSVYPHPIAFNVLPHIDVFDESGYTGEERKVAAETRKMLGMPDLRGQRDLRARAGALRPLPVGPDRDDRQDLGRRRPEPADGRPRRRAGGRAGAQPLPAAARRRGARRRAGGPHPRGLLARPRAGAVALERQPAQGRGDQRRADRGVAGHAGLALKSCDRETGCLRDRRGRQTAS